MLGDITTLLGSLGYNIVQQLNTSKDAIAYNVVDLEGLERSAAADEAQHKLLELPGVLSTRIIWLGNVSEGPSSFFTKS